MNKLSVTIATKNEEKNIETCLRSVSWADEIVIVDDYSSDRTVEIAKQFTDKIFLRESGIDFHLNKNYAIEKASGQWILSLDADEVVTHALKQEILAGIEKENILGYILNRKNLFLGKWIRSCGWYPDRILRLFRKGATNWPLHIHKTPQISGEGNVHMLKNPFLHNSYTSFSQYLEKLNLYTTALARYQLEEKKKLRLFKSFFLEPLFIFVKKYILLKGYKDGFYGFFISFASSLTVIMTYAKVYELTNDE